MKNYKKDNSRIDRNIELLKIHHDSYKKHFDWIAKGFIIYLVIISAVFGIISKSTDNFIIIVLYIAIGSASICVIYVTFLISSWVKKYIKGIKEFELSLECNLDHMYYLAKKVSKIPVIISIVILISTLILLSVHINKNIL